MTTSAVLHRLSCRGELKITVRDGVAEVRFDPYRPHNMTVDVADVREYAHLGASAWTGKGPDLDELLTGCEYATRPPERDVDGIVYDFRNRRATRTAGPPLPFWTLTRGWRPGQERWLRCSSHEREYLNGYRRDLWEEAHYRFQQMESQRRIEARRQAARSDLVSRDEVVR